MRQGNTVTPARRVVLQQAGAQKHEYAATICAEEKHRELHYNAFLFLTFA